MAFEFISPEVDIYIGAVIVVAIFGFLVYLISRIKMAKKEKSEVSNPERRSSKSRLPAETEAEATTAQEDTTAEQGEESAAEQLRRATEGTAELAQDMESLSDPSLVQEAQGISLLEQAEAYFNSVSEKLNKSSDHLSRFIASIHGLRLIEYREEKIFEKEKEDIEKIEVVLERDLEGLNGDYNKEKRNLEYHQQELQRLEGLASRSAEEERRIDYIIGQLIEYLNLLNVKGKINGDLLSHIKHKKEAVSRLVKFLFSLEKQLANLEKIAEYLPQFERNILQENQRFSLKIRQIKGLVMSGQAVNQEQVNQIVHDSMGVILGHIMKMMGHLRTINSNLLKVSVGMINQLKLFIKELELSEDAVKDFKKTIQINKLEKNVFRKKQIEGNEDVLIQRIENVEKTLISRAVPTLNKIEEQKKLLLEILKGLNNYLRELNHNKKKIAGE